MTTKILGIVGPSMSKIPNDENLILALKNEVRRAMVGDWDEIASGGATGIDEFAKQIAAEQRLMFRAIIPRHNHWDGSYKSCPTPNDCFGFKARNMALANWVTKLVCIVFNIESWPKWGPLCYHCLSRLDSKLVTHRANGGCWTLNYAQDIGKDVELREVIEW
jgi:hypothetical protein